MKIESRIIVPVFVFAFITSALALATVMMSKYIALNMLPSPIEAKAIRHKSSHYFSSLPSARRGNISPFFSQPNIAYPASCINYNPYIRTITVSCSSARLTDIYNQIHDSNILSKQSPPGTWLLNANIVIAKEATFHIDTTDTKWLKIVSDQAIPSLPYNIDVHGSFEIDSVKITSWDPTTNNYAISNGSREAVPTGTIGATPNGYIIHYGAPRGFIEVERDATDTTDITNSEIAYLGYESGISDIGSGGLNYYGANGSVMR